MSFSKGDGLSQDRVKTSGNLYLDEVLKGIRREGKGNPHDLLPSAPEIHPRSPRAPPHRPRLQPLHPHPEPRAGLKPSLHTLCHTALALAVLFALLNYILPIEYAYPPSPSRRSVLSSGCLEDAQVRGDSVLDALQNSKLSLNHEMLVPLRDLKTTLTAHLSKAIRTIDILGSHIGVELSHFVKIAAHTTECVHFSRIQPALHQTQNYTRQAINILKASLPLYDNALSIIAVAHSDVQQAISSSEKDARNAWPLIFGIENSKGCKKKREIFKKKQDWSSELTQATEHLQIGKNAVSLDMARYVRFEADLGVLKLETIEYLEGGQTSENRIDLDWRCSPSSIGKFESSFLKVILSAVGNVTAAEAFRDYYATL